MAGTMYLNIPKERAASILTNEKRRYVVSDSKTTDDKIVILRDKPFATSKRAELTNYKTGKDCEVTYYHDEVYDILNEWVI